MSAEPSSRGVRIQYYALLREERGLAEERLITGAMTPRMLYAELKARHGFSLSAEQLAVAVNDAFGEWDEALQQEDTVVFIPPVAGG